MSVWSDAVAALSPFAWYRMGEASGTTLVDASGNGRNGTYSASGVTYGVAGLVPGGDGTAVTLGTSPTATSAASLGLSSTSITHAVTIKSTSARDALFVATTGTYRLELSGATATMRLDVSTSVPLGYASANLYDGVAHFVVVKVTTTTVEMWVDGVMVGSGAHTAASAVINQIRVKNTLANPVATFDEWLLWNRALTTSEIEGLSAAWTGGAVIPKTTAATTVAVGSSATATPAAPANTTVTVDSAATAAAATQAATSVPVESSVLAYAVGGAIPTTADTTVDVQSTATAFAVALTDAGATVAVTSSATAREVEPGLPPVVGDTGSRTSGRSRAGVAAATWNPPVVAPPYATPRADRNVGAQALSNVAMVGAQPVFTSSEATKVRMRHRILVGGRDVSFYRDVATPEPSYQLAEPLLWGTASIELPQISAVFEHPGKGALRWCRKGAPVVLQRVNAAGEIVSVDYRGVVVGHDISGKNLRLEVGGHATGRAALRHKPLPIFRDTLDLGRLAWAAIRDLGLRFEPRLGPTTGIKQALWGGMDHLTYVTELCAKAWERDGTQWTVMPSDAGVYRMKRKDRETVDFTVFTDDSRAVPHLRSDAAEEPNRIFASGVTPKGQRVRFGVYPGLKPAKGARYPFDDDRPFGFGTTDADTDTGDGVTIMVRRLWTTGYLSLEDASGEFDGDVRRAIVALQEDAGIHDGPLGYLDRGQMDVETWNALWDLDVTGYSLRGSRIEPAAQAPRTRRYFRSGSGAVIRKNPRFDRHALIVDRPIDFGTGFTRHQMREWSSAEIARGEDNWVGTIEITTGGVLHGEVAPGTVISGDDIMDVRAIQPGMNAWLPLFAGGIKVHVSGVQIKYANGIPTATLYVDTQARDAMAVWDIIRRNRESRRDPARRWKGNRASSEVKDSIVEWDEVGGVLYDDVDLQPGWNVVPVVAGQEGTVARLRLKVATTAGEDGDGVEFACAVFGKEISAGRLNALVKAPLADSVIEDPENDEDEDTDKPPPLIGDRAWERKSVKKALRARWHLYSAGTYREPCGYSPGRKTWETTTSQADNPDYDPDVDKNSTGTDDDEFISLSTETAHGKLTGEHEDDAGFSYRTARQPVLYLAVFVRREAVLKGGRVMWNQLEAGA